MFSFSLSPFQIESIEAIQKGHNVLVTAHTGSGKSVPFEFAVEYYSKREGPKNKLIYCSPIKALSNQKYYELTRKFPDIRIGILTGDIKVNTDANVLIMTTEILHNMLFSPHSLFSMDIEKELAAVVFDELHYINDKSRGHIWENTIMKLPISVQLIMLSATLDNPVEFAEWITLNKPHVPICIAGTTERVVPLVHYSFLACGQQFFKLNKKDECLCKKVKDQIGEPKIIQGCKTGFSEAEYQRVKNVVTTLKQQHIRITRPHVLNSVTQYLKEREMFPAICFILSRKQLVESAKEVTTVLLEDDSKVPYIARRECETLVRKLPNFQEYLSLPEYEEVVRLLEKGIGIHHAGMMPVLREIVEMFLTRGFIKLLFATETFALGVNFPIKTVLFTDITKFDGTQRRILLPHEYTQMAGRAGRRGLDKIGHVIHLNNLFMPDISLTDYKTMMQGRAQSLKSKFKISPSLLLGLVKNGQTDFVDFCEKSMLQTIIKCDVYTCTTRIQTLQSSLQHVFCNSSELLEEYIHLLKIKSTSVNKKKREAEKGIELLLSSNPTLILEVEPFLKNKEILDEIAIAGQDLQHAQTYIKREIDEQLLQLYHSGHLVNGSLELTKAGEISLLFREVDGILFSLLYEKRLFEGLSAIQIIQFLSCFAELSISEDVKQLAVPAGKLFDFLKEYEFDCEVQYDLAIPFVEDWCNCGTQEECKFVLQTMEFEKGIYLGEFVKAMLKVCNIAAELEKVCELFNDLELLSIIKQIPELVMKFVVTNQSLYV